MVGIAIEKIIKEFEAGSLTFENIENRYLELSQQHNVLVTVELCNIYMPEVDLLKLSRSIKPTKYSSYYHY